MKKSIASIFLFITGLFSFASHSYAQVSFQITQPDQTVNANRVGVGSVVNFIINILVVIGVIAALAYLLYGGIKYITSGGDKGAVEAAKGHIVAAIVGLLIVILSFVILNVVFSILGITEVDIFNINIPAITTPQT